MLYPVYKYDPDILDQWSQEVAQHILLSPILHLRNYFDIHLEKFKFLLSSINKLYSDLLTWLQEQKSHHNQFISCWGYPFATSLALPLIIFPSESVLFLNTHFVPTIDLFFGLGTSFQTSFLSNSFISYHITVTQSTFLSTSSTFFLFLFG